jgi:hypothetical protein
LLLRVLFALLVLFSLRPHRAEASIVVDQSPDSYSFEAADTDFTFGAIRSGSGWELLLEFAERLPSPAPGSQSRHVPSRHNDRLLTTARDLLAMRSRRVVLGQELELPCGDSPFLVYLPYHANPPPVLS